MSLIHALKSLSNLNKFAVGVSGLWHERQESCRPRPLLQQEGPHRPHPSQEGSSRRRLFCLTIIHLRSQLCVFSYNNSLQQFVLLQHFVEP